MSGAQRSNCEQLEVAMRSPLFVAIGALWLSAITAAWATGNGGGQKDFVKVTTENNHMRHSLHAGTNKQDESSWSKYGCRDDLNKDLLTPMWCKEKEAGSDNPLYPFRSERTQPEHNVFPHLWAGRRFSIEEFKNVQ
jgi:hypothetical protein